MVSHQTPACARMHICVCRVHTCVCAHTIKHTYVYESTRTCEHTCICVCQSTLLLLRYNLPASGFARIHLRARNAYIPLCAHMYGPPVRICQHAFPHVEKVIQLICACTTLQRLTAVRKRVHAQPSIWEHMCMHIFAPFIHKNAYDCGRPGIHTCEHTGT